jgi:hypothetical protein
MTFAPPTLVTLGKYLVSQGAVNLGIKGDTAHVAKGWSYHLGADDLAVGASSARLERDVAGLSNAASAIDIGKVGGSLVGLQKLSAWLSRECVNRAVDTLDLREVIYSPDGSKVFRWDEPTQQVYESKFVDGRWTQGDLSHRTHTHISYFRDAEFRDKTALFRRYWEDEVITAIKGEDWKPTVTNGVSNGVYRATPERAAPLVARLGADSVIRTIAEISADGNNWRLSEVGGVPAYFLRADLAPLVQGGDPGVDGQLTDYINRVPVAPVIDCGPLVNAARAEGVAAGLRDGSRAVKDAAVNAAVLYGG